MTGGLYLLAGVVVSFCSMPLCGDCGAYWCCCSAVACCIAVGYLKNVWFSFVNSVDYLNLK